MREISGSSDGREVEDGFHRRMRAYLDDEGRAWAHVGCYNEGLIDKVYGEEDKRIHVWGMTKILKSLSEDYARTGSSESRRQAALIVSAFRKLMSWDGSGRCWLPNGMGALNPDGTPIPNGWNKHPAPLIEPLLTYWLATKDKEGLELARACADGTIGHCQPGGLEFGPDGSFDGHSHGTMHSVWGIAHLGVLTGEMSYIEFAKRAWDWFLTRGTGTGWFPAGPDNCNETCCISDVMSIASLVARAGYPEYFDFVERYARNYVSNLQFLVTPEFEAYYRRLHASVDPAAVDMGLEELRKFQGGIIGGSGLNDYENILLGGVSGFEMFGCCAPEGMRAIHTTWSNTIDKLPETPLGPAGVYVNMSFQRESPWGTVYSFMPNQGRLSVVATVEDRFHLRAPHWTAKDEILAFKNSRQVACEYENGYVGFDAVPGDELTICYPLYGFEHRVAGLWPKTDPDLELTFTWLGNMVTSVDPPPRHTPLFTGRPRRLPQAPSLGPSGVQS